MTSETAAQQRSHGWSARQTLAAVGVAAVVAGLGGAAIYAATESPAHTMTGGTHGAFAPSGPPPAPSRQAPTGALHSEYVVSDGHGGYTTMLTQTGTVDEVTLSSVVVRSDDGYTQIYALPPGAAGTNNSVAVNDTVTVAATRTGSTVTLTSIGNGPPHGN